MSPSAFEPGNELYVKVDDLNHSFRDQRDSQMKVAENSRCSKVKKGSIIFPKRGAAIMTNKVRIMGAYGYMDTNMMALEPEEISSEFLYLFINKTGLYKIADTSTIPQINNKHIEPYEIMVPIIEEQQQIGRFFQNLDNLITLHQRKLEKIKSIKAAYLTEMFPQEGATIPRRRFPGFTEAWEQRKLGDVVQITMGQSPDGSSYTDIPSDYILVQGNADLKNGWVTPRVWTSQVTKKAEAGDLIMSVRAPAGEMGKTAYNAVIGRGVAAIKGNEFIFQSLVKMNEEGYWKKLSCGSTFESLNSDNIKNAEIMIPNLNEQAQIGTFFKNLDNLITLHQRKLNKLIDLKKAYLNEMFI
jgi:type I restriction enzyme S subunit